MWKTRMQHQKFRDTVRVDLGGVGFAIGFKSGARAQQADPFQVSALRFRMIGMMKRPEMHANQDGEAHGTLQEPASLNELPALGVGHGGIRNALKKVSAFFDRKKKFASAPHVLSTRIADRMK